MSVGIGNPITGASGFALLDADDVAIDAREFEAEVSGLTANTEYKRGMLLSITSANAIVPYSSSEQAASFVLMENFKTGASTTARVRVANGLFKREKLLDASGNALTITDAIRNAAATRGLVLVDFKK